MSQIPGKNPPPTPVPPGPALGNPGISRAAQAAADPPSLAVSHGGSRDGRAHWRALEASAKPFRHSDRGEPPSSRGKYLQESGHFPPPSVTVGAWRELGARAISLRDFPIFPPWLEPKPRFFLQPGRIVQCANYPCVFRGLFFSQLGGTFCLCVCVRARPPPPCSAGPKKKTPRIQRGFERFLPLAP